MRVLLLPFLFVYVGQVSKESPSGEGFCVVAEGEGQKCSTARNFLQRSVRRSAVQVAVHGGGMRVRASAGSSLRHPVGPYVFSNSKLNGFFLTFNFVPIFF